MLIRIQNQSEAGSECIKQQTGSRKKDVKYLQNCITSIDSEVEYLFVGLHYTLM